MVYTMKLNRTNTVNRLLQFSFLFISLYLLIRHWEFFLLGALGLLIGSSIIIAITGFFAFRWYKKNIKDPIEDMKKQFEAPFESFTQRKENDIDPKHQVIVVEAETIPD